MVWEVLDEMSDDPQYQQGFVRGDLQKEVELFYGYRLYHEISFVLQEARRAGLLSIRKINHRYYRYYFGGKRPGSLSLPLLSL